mmetsp:Transcript_62358/g.115742  ORF Transcript_62358/g.115742 Transcript_62358/m.115742 type:complete len:120 (-) Transcript_62358:81-440(-)
MLALSMTPIYMWRTPLPSSGTLPHPAFASIHHKIDAAQATSSVRGEKERSHWQGHEAIHLGMCCESDLQETPRRRLPHEEDVEKEGLRRAMQQLDAEALARRRKKLLGKGKCECVFEAM